MQGSRVAEEASRKIAKSIRNFKTDPHQGNTNESNVSEKFATGIR
jgi:hypothetical protein